MTDSNQADMDNHAKPLYKAYACEKLDGGKFLLPGFPVESGTKPPQAGGKILVELADGTRLQTTAINTKVFIFNESLMAHMNVRAKPDAMYYSIQVPDDFLPEAVNLGVQVFLDD